MKATWPKKRHTGLLPLIGEQLIQSTERVLRARGVNPDYYTIDLASHGCRLVRWQTIPAEGDQTATFKTTICGAVFTDGHEIMAPETAIAHWQQELQRHDLTTGAQRTNYEQTSLI